MDYPSSVAVGPYVYTIQKTYNHTSEPLAELGKTDFHYHQITVAHEQSEGSARDTVLHEVMHTVWELMKLDREKHEEPVVSALATGLLDVLRRNPELVSYLVG